MEVASCHVGYILWLKRKSQVPPTFTQRELFFISFGDEYHDGAALTLSISSFLQRAQTMCVLGSETLSSSDHKENNPVLCTAKARQYSKKERTELTKGLSGHRELQQEYRRLRFRTMEREIGKCSMPGQVLERVRVVFPKGPNVKV